MSSIGFGELPADPERRPNLNSREPSGFRCESCGKDFSSHLGLVGTCTQLTAAQQRVAELEQQLTVEVLSHGVIEWNGSIWDLRDSNDRPT